MHPSSHVPVGFVQKLKKSPARFISFSLCFSVSVSQILSTRAINVMDAQQLLERLKELGPRNFSDTMQVTQILTSCWEKDEGMDKFSAHAVISILRAAQELLLQSQEVHQVLSALHALASKILKWCEISCVSASKSVSDFKPSGAISEMQKVLIEVLMFAHALFTNLESCLFLEEIEFRSGAVKFVCQFLDSFKIFCIFYQKEQLHDEFQKVAQEVLSEALKVLVKLRENFIAAYGEETFDSLDDATMERAHIILYGVNAFMDIGKFAAMNRRDWVGMLNIAWKGVIALLQTVTGKDAMSKLLDIHQIIRIMVDCTTGSLRNAADSWNTALREKDGNNNVTELKRHCIPVKFFLLNIIRVITHYPCQTVGAFNDIVECALKIISLRLEMSELPHLMFAAEAIVENLEPSLFILLRNLFNSSEIQFHSKLQLLNGLIGVETEDGSSLLNDVGKGKFNEVNERITRTCSGHEANLLLCRLMIYLGLLQSCQDCGDKMSHELAKRLDFLLQMICDNRIYAKMFEPQISATQMPAKAICLYRTLLKTLQIFFIVLAGTEAWAEAEEFLYRNILHPHMLCRELILELWCFVSRHCEQSMIHSHIQDLLHVLSDLLKSSFATFSDWPIRTITRLICLLIKVDPCYLATKVYELAFGMDPFAAIPTLDIATALLREHFPMTALHEELRSLFISSATKTLSELWNQVMKNSRENAETLQSIEKTLCSLFETLCQENFARYCDTEKLHELTKMSVEFLEACHRNSDCGIKSQSLKYFSGIWLKMHPHKIRSIVVSLHHLVLESKIPEPDQKCIKIGLAEALAGLGELSMPEDDTDPTNLALWELYHLILRERHWAYAHLALASFGYFVAHTSWNELWRFVPSDAALAHDARTGRLADESIFMSSLRCFLEKEVSTPANGNVAMALQREGEVLERALLEFNHITDRAHGVDAQGEVDSDHTDVDSSMQVDSLETSLPPEINHAMRMLQEGMLLLKEKLPTWFKHSGHNLEQQHQMHDQLSLLADVIGQLNVLHPS